jgi:Na+-translocating ferredoxin:NAD+ oxidoreductase RnfG subunit
VVKSITVFVLLVVLCALILALVYSATHGRIEQNRARQFVDSVNRLIGQQGPLPAMRWRNDLWHLCNGTALIRGQTRGYGGPIRWLVAVDLETGTPHLRGFQTSAHQETPGIADFLTRQDDPWLQQLRGRNSQNIQQVATLTGATITSRAVVAAVTGALAHSDLHNVQCES